MTMIVFLCVVLVALLGAVSIADVLAGRVDVEKRVRKLPHADKPDDWFNPPRYDLDYLDRYYATLRCSIEIEGGATEDAVLAAIDPWFHPVAVTMTVHGPNLLRGLARILEMDVGGRNQLPWAPTWGVFIGSEMWDAGCRAGRATPIILENVSRVDGDSLLRIRIGNPHPKNHPVTCYITVYGVPSETCPCVQERRPPPRRGGTRRKPVFS